MNKISINNRGFTLVEAIISLAVLSIGILALFAMQTLSIRGNANASRITTLATWGSDEIEQKLITATDTQINTFTQDALDLAGDANYSIQKTRTEDSPVENVTTIDVTITNKLDGKQVTLRYLKARSGL